MLWRLAFIVEGGKNLEQILVAVQGKALNMEGPTLVVNAEVQKGKVKAKTRSGTQVERALAALEEKLKTGDHITSQQMIALIKAEHIPPTNYSHIVTLLKKQKRLTLVKRGLWMFHSASKE